LDCAGLEEPLYDTFILFVEGFVVIPNTMLQSFYKTLIIDMIKMRLKILQFDVEK
jgi:hypothetical protein